VKLAGYIKWDGEPPPLTVFLRPVLAQARAAPRAELSDSATTRDNDEETEEVLVEAEGPSASSKAALPRLAPKPKVRSDPPPAVKPVKAKSMPKGRRTPMQVTAFPGPGLQATFLRESDSAEGTVVAVTTDTIQVHLKDGSYGELTVPGSFRKSFRCGDVVKQMEVVGMEPEQPILLALTRPALAVDGVDIDLSAMERPKGYAKDAQKHKT
ncbi:unnamed protein product, partial [Symbiodinium sp. CCMP2456]